MSKYKKVKIYDLDGTLIDSLHRYRVKDGKIDLPYWRENDTPAKVAQDGFRDLIKWLRVDLEREDTYVIYATARACVKNDHNYQFLKDHNIIPNRFIHREGEEDQRGGAALKIEGLKPILSQKQLKDATVHIFEDNLDYLRDLVLACKGTHKTVGHFIPSEQGH